jgi:hypothetical protein
MAGGEVRTIVLTVAIITLLAVGLYMVDPTMCGMVKMSDGFTSSSMPVMPSAATGSVPPSGMAGNVPAPGAMPGASQLAAMPPMTPPVADASMGPMGPMGPMGSMGPKKENAQNPGEGFANLEDITGPADFGSTPNANGCYPRDQLTPGELLPKDGNSTWAQQNPMGTGSLKGKNFLSAGALVGVNTVGQSLRNANQQLRSEPPNPQVPVSVFFNSTIEPDTNRRDMEIA